MKNVKVIGELKPISIGLGWKSGDLTSLDKNKSLYYGYYRKNTK